MELHASTDWATIPARVLQDSLVTHVESTSTNVPVNLANTAPRASTASMGTRALAPANIRAETVKLTGTLAGAVPVKTELRVPTSTALSRALVNTVTAVLPVSRSLIIASRVPASMAERVAAQLVHSRVPVHPDMPDPLATCRTAPQPDATILLRVTCHTRQTVVTLQ